MENCLHCKKRLVHVVGRKEKSFCNVNCRNKYFYAKRKQEVELAKAALVSLPADYVLPKKVAILTEKGEVKPVLPEPRKKPHSGFTEEAGSIINHPIKPPIEAYDAPPLSKNVQDELAKIQPTKPRTLDELKSLCPAELKGLDRSQWISTERQKYGI